VPRKTSLLVSQFQFSNLLQQQQKINFNPLLLQTCRAFRDAGRNQSVWQAKALELYPPSTLILSPRSSYTDYRSLCLDDNSQNASLLIPFPNGGLSSDYIMNRPDYFFECCITALQYNRNNDTLHIFFDCRGEVDLRDPLSSSIAFVVHRPRPDRRELREELARLSIQRQELREMVERLDPLLKEEHAAEDAAPRHLAAVRALHISSHRLYTLSMELQDCSTIGFSDCITVLRPSSKDSEYHYEINKPGHFKGWLQFNAVCSQIDSLLGTDVDSFWTKKKAIVQHGVDLVFTYANPVPVLPQMNQIDYHPVTLLTIPPATTVAETLKGEGKYVSNDEFHESFLIHESVEEEWERWSHVQREMEVAGRYGRGRRAPLNGGTGTGGGGGFSSWFV